MAFRDVIEKYSEFDFNSFCSSVTPDRVRAVLSKEQLTEMDFLSLLSSSSEQFLEEMAVRAHALTRKQHGNSVVIFTPLYISNFCDNRCAYCSFASQHSIERRHLGFDEIREEAVKIGKSGIRHILMLTGESRSMVSPEYLQTAVKILHENFSSVAVEIYPLSEQEYGQLISSGADGLTIYQETYNEPLYGRLHKGGPKGDYNFRVEAPERACRQGIRSVTVGALLGLYDWHSEAFFTGLHAAYLQKQFPSVEVSVSFPRLRPLAGEFNSGYQISDSQFVQIMTAMRNFLPSAGITISTRESESFRNSILPLGVTKMSAGSSTAVGAHSGKPSTTQFEIADSRDVDQMRADLLKLGFQPVMHDWNGNYVK